MDEQWGSVRDGGRTPASGRTAASARTVASAAYDGDPEMIAEARGFAGDFLADARGGFGIPVSTRLAGAVELIVSELVTNSCKYAPGPCLVDLAASADCVEIAVWDACAAFPVASAPRPDRIGGHGMEIVMGLCDGFAVRRELVGKRITASVPVADERA